jgi:GNAT superfamily N-acetyltransferase
MRHRHVSDSTDLVIRALKKSDARAFLSLVDALADYEKLSRPTPAGRLRLLRDSMGAKKRISVLLAFLDRAAVGYAIILETYSSFLALPTLYLEDIFILPRYRSRGIGLRLFQRCAMEASRRGCGRMEWMVLDWNTGAQHFYERLGAPRLTNWYTYRLHNKEFRRIALL